MTQEQSNAVNSPTDIPDFDSEDDERAYWDTHHFGPGMLSGFTRVGVHPALATRADESDVRLPAHTLHRLQNLAARKGVPFQTLVQEFITERLYEEEKREGIIGG